MSDELLQACLSEFADLKASVNKRIKRAYQDGKGNGQAQYRTRIERLEAENAGLRELLKLCEEIVDDDLENRPARHSLGNLSARLREALKGGGDE